jgi:chromate transporter
MPPPRETDAAGAAEPAIPFREAVRAWARIGLESFGGPAGQIAAMHRIVVVEKRWIDESRFLQALNVCMLLPGPEAMQLATYLGWLLHRTVGGVVAGMLFILPGFLSILALSLLYAAASGTAAVAGLFFGLKAAVIALIAVAVLRLARRMLRTAIAALIAVAAFVAVELLALPFPLVILAAAAAGIAAERWSQGSPDREPIPAAGGDRVDERPLELRALARPLLVWLPLWLLPTAVLLASLGDGSIFTRLAIFLSAAAAVSFGGAYAVLAFVAQHAVEGEGWITASQMLDGLALGEATPGPLIQVVQFVAFLAAESQPGGLPPIVAGVLASLLATWVTFAPSFLFVFLAAPCMERLRRRRDLQAALAGIGAAVVGVIASLGLWFALTTLFARVETVEAGPLRLRLPSPSSLDLASLSLLAAALLLLHRRWRTLAVLAACGAVGVLLRLLQGSPP